MRWERLSSSCLSEYRMDRHLLCLEQEAERHDSEAHLAVCPRCQQELAWLRQEQAHFLAHPALPDALQQVLLSPITPANTDFSSMSPKTSADGDFATTKASAHGDFATTKASAHGDFATTKASAHGRRSQWSWSAWVSWPTWATLATCSFALFLSLSWQQWFLPSHTIYRGTDSPLFLVGLKRGALIRQMASGEQVKAGDHIRLAYQWRTEKPAYLYVIHRDQEGRFSPLYPDTPNRPSLRIETPNETTLPGSLEFDQAAHGHEEIWACFSTRPLRFPTILAQLPSPETSARWRARPHGLCAFLVLYQFRRTLR